MLVESAVPAKSHSGAADISWVRRCACSDTLADEKRSRTNSRAPASLPGGREAWANGSTAFGPKLVTLDFEDGQTVFPADQAALSHKLQRTLVIQFRRPIDIEFEAASRRQRLFRSEHDSRARHIHGLTETRGFFAGPILNNAEMNLALDGKAIRTAPVWLMALSAHVGCTRVADRYPCWNRTM